MSVTQGRHHFEADADSQRIFHDGGDGVRRSELSMSGEAGVIAEEGAGDGCETTQKGPMHWARVRSGSDHRAAETAGQGSGDERTRHGASRSTGEFIAHYFCDGQRGESMSDTAVTEPPPVIMIERQSVIAGGLRDGGSGGKSTEACSKAEHGGKRVGERGAHMVTVTAMPKRVEFNGGGLRVASI